MPSRTQTKPKSAPDTAARSTPRQARAAKTVQKILDASIDLVASEGAASVTTSSIAKAAGVPVGTVYRYFKDKDEIFSHLADQFQQEVDDHFADFLPLDAEAMSEMEFLDAWLENLIEQMKARPAFIELLRLAVRLPDHYHRTRRSTARWIPEVGRLPVFNALDIPLGDRKAFYDVWINTGWVAMELSLLADTDEDYQRLKNQAKLLLLSYFGHYQDQAR